MDEFFQNFKFQRELKGSRNIWLHFQFELMSMQVSCEKMYQFECCFLSLSITSFQNSALYREIGNLLQFKEQTFIMRLLLKNVTMDIAKT